MGTENTIDTLKAKRVELIKQIEHIDAVLGLLGVSTILVNAEKKETVTTSPININYSEYTLKEAVYLFIKNTGRFISSKEIADGLLIDFGKTDADKFRIQVSGLISALRADEKLVKYQYGPSLKDSVWGLPFWVDSNNEPKESFKPVLPKKISIFDEIS